MNKNNDGNRKKNDNALASRIPNNGKQPQEKDKFSQPIQDARKQNNVVKGPLNPIPLESTSIDSKISMVLITQLALVGT